jgi:hypothetical protein
MIANIYHNGTHTKLNIEIADLEELIARSGWTVVDGIENLSDVARAEINRLENQEYLETSGQGIQWWRARLVSETPMLTPDCD